MLLTLSLISFTAANKPGNKDACDGCHKLLSKCQNVISTKVRPVDVLADTKTGLQPSNARPVLCHVPLQGRQGKRILSREMQVRLHYLLCDRGSG
jgi:hypothetical protein